MYSFWAVSRETLAWVHSRKLAVSHKAMHLPGQVWKAVVDLNPFFFPSGSAGGQYPSYLLVSPDMLSSFSWELFIIVRVSVYFFGRFVCLPGRIQCVQYSENTAESTSLALSFTTLSLFFIAEMKKKGWAFEITLISRPLYGMNVFYSSWLNFLSIQSKPHSSNNLVLPWHLSFINPKVANIFSCATYFEIATVNKAKTKAHWLA